MNRSEQINELAAALAKAQGEIKGAIKDTSNPFFKSKYADLASVWDACRGPLSSNGLSVVQGAYGAESGIGMETMLMHSSGQWMSAVLTMPVSKMDAQGFGSAITYARRYGLQSMVGIAPEDDDGNAAAATLTPAKAVLRANVKPEAGVIESLSGDQQLRCKMVASLVVDAFNIPDMDMALRIWTSKKAELSQDEHIATWQLIGEADKTKRAQLKRMGEEQAMRQMGQA